MTVTSRGASGGPAVIAVVLVDTAAVLVVVAGALVERTVVDAAVVGGAVELVWLVGWATSAVVVAEAAAGLGPPVPHRW